jgi:hypothetical protein
MIADEPTTGELAQEAYEDELLRVQGPMRDGVYWWSEDELIAITRDDATRRWFVVSINEPDAEIACSSMRVLRRANVGNALHITAATMAHVIRNTKDEEQRDHLREQLRRALEAAS